MKYFFAEERLTEINAYPFNLQILNLKFSNLETQFEEKMTSKNRTIISLNIKNEH